MALATYTSANNPLPPVTLDGRITSCTAGLVAGCPAVRVLYDTCVVGECV
jgi:hypothetical protein